MGDITGETFEYLHVVKFVGRNPRGRALYLCQCTRCGTEVVRRDDSLTTGKTKSCGCLNRMGGRPNFIERRRSYKPANRTVEGIILFCIYASHKEQFGEFLDGETVKSQYGTIYRWDVPKINSLSPNQQEQLLEEVRHMVLETDGKGSGSRR